MPLHKPRSIRQQQSPPCELGQAIIIIAVAAVALTSMLALVIDTGHLYVEQRRMQTAADAAATAAAQNWLSAPSQLNIAPAIADGRIYATYNGYTTSVTAGNGAWDPANEAGVRVSIPPATGPYSNSAQYVEVVISEPVSTFFGGIFNIGTVRVSARAVARGMVGALDAAVIALSNDIAAMTTAGSSSTNVYGNVYSAGGIKCANGNITVYQGGAYAVSGFGTNCLNGQLQAAGGLHSNPPRIYDPRWPSAESQALPGPGGNWTSAGHYPEADGYIHVAPGTYNSITVGPGEFVKFDGGVYHLLGAGDSPALSIKGTVASGGALQFVLESGAIHFEAQASGTLASGPEFNNILLYSKRTDGGNAIQITGGATLTYDGTIYAPGANIFLAGASAAVINGQVVANTVTFAGNSGTAINWNSALGAVVIRPALVE